MAEQQGNSSDDTKPKLQPRDDSKQAKTASKRDTNTQDKISLDQFLKESKTVLVASNEGDVVK